MAGLKIQRAWRVGNNPAGEVPCELLQKYKSLI